MPIVEIDRDLCSHCNTCVDVCPLDVLRESEDGAPFVAYREDCQSCFLCRILCPAGAIQVTPDRARPTPLAF